MVKDEQTHTDLSRESVGLYSSQAPCSELRPAPSLSHMEPQSLVGCKAVIVEDEGVTQMQLKRALTKAGLAVVGTAINGRDGVEAVLRERPDIVLLDIRMPIMDGLEAARRIMAQYPVCIVMLTAFSEDTYQEEARKIGTSGYIVKPITSDLLLPQILTAYSRFLSKPSETQNTSDNDPYNNQ